MQPLRLADRAARNVHAIQPVDLPVEPVEQPFCQVFQRWYFKALNIVQVTMIELAMNFFDSRLNIIKIS